MNHKKPEDMTIESILDMNNVIGYDQKDQEIFIDSLDRYFVNENKEVLTIQGDDPEMIRLMNELKADVVKSKFEKDNKGRAVIIKEAGFITYEGGRAILEAAITAENSNYNLIVIGPKKSNWNGVKKRIHVLGRW